ncbi:MAG TPA: acyl carrier protein [Thermomicrobiales bacterium]|nr:acyl carrier protein [Thermomicrobiales bacterium]
MAGRAEVEGALYGVLAESRGSRPAAVREEAGADGTIDSLEGVELVAAAEERFGVEIADDELTPDTCRSVVALADLVLAKLGAVGAGR